MPADGKPFSCRATSPGPIPRHPFHNAKQNGVADPQPAGNRKAALTAAAEPA